MEKCPETGILYAAQIEIRVQFVAHGTDRPGTLRVQVPFARASRQPGEGPARSPKFLKGATIGV
jgi:hypothetical protein